MTNLELKGMIQCYRDILDGFISVQFSDDKVPIDRSDRMSHARWMCDRMIEMLNRDQYDAEKFNRWLGFVQACLWSDWKFTIGELKQHMRLP